MSPSFLWSSRLEHVIVQPDKPTDRLDRIDKLDHLRGFAVLGILIMNIQSFAMVKAAYSNPMVSGGTDPVNMMIWGFGQLFADQKFMTLFSVLYGAGIWLFCDRLEARGQEPMYLFMRRSGWLLLFGMIHGYCLWYGDILFSYAAAGAMVFFLRLLPSRHLFVAGALCLMVPFVLTISITGLVQLAPEAERVAMEGSWLPDSVAIAAEAVDYNGSWLSQMPRRFEETKKMQTLAFPLYIAWRVGALMLWGMALMKSGILSGGKSRRFYKHLAVWGLLSGLACGLTGLWIQWSSGFAMLSSKFVADMFDYWGSLPMAAAYLAIVMLLKEGVFTRYLSAAGRMAFTNYLSQTVICTLIFYGHGLGLFGQVSRMGQLIMVLAIWSFQLVTSKLWLDHFRFGPMEWVWRSLTYGHLQPFKRS